MGSAEEFDFELVNFHFHSGLAGNDGSEHAIDGERTDAELNLVHSNESGGLSVLGALIEVGETNEILEPVFEAVEQELQDNGEVPAEVEFEEDIDLLSLLPNDFSGWFYNGSLTTPPATEGVNFFILENSIEISEEQLNIFSDYIESIGFVANNRPLQPLNGRQFNELSYQVPLDEETSQIDDLNFGNVTVPESNSTLGTLAVGTLGAGAALKRKLKQKSTAKRT